MIFISTGTQFPFDRLIQILDDMASSMDEKFIAQAIPGKYIPKNFELMESITPTQFNKYVEESRVVVAHAGMGSIITSLIYNKPIIVFPRLASLGEHRNEHQTATADHFSKMGYVYLAKDAADLRLLISNDNLEPLHKLGDYASQQLVDAVDDFISK